MRALRFRRLSGGTEVEGAYEVDDTEVEGAYEVDDTESRVRMKLIILEYILPLRLLVM